MQDTDKECVGFLRHCGMTDADIADVLEKPLKEVQAVPPFITLFDAARPVLAKVLGDVADNFETVGTA